MHVLMAITLVAGFTMLFFTLAYRGVLRKVEVLGRILLALLALHSVSTRIMSLIPGHKIYVEIAYPLFDILYIGLFVIFNVNVFRRKKEANGKERRTTDTADPERGR